jgi:hypothetical protein
VGNEQTCGGSNTYYKICSFWLIPALKSDQKLKKINFDRNLIGEQVKYFMKAAGGYD